MKFHWIIIVMLSSVACSFKSPDKDDNAATQNYEEIKTEDLARMDTDGDRISDLEEKERGLNPFVADIPVLRTRFLQNYAIKVNWHAKDLIESIGNFSIDTRVVRNDPDFKYRVGEVLVRTKAFQEASRIGRFSSHSWGDIKESDLTRVVYPEVDARFTGNNNLRIGQYFNNPHVAIDNVTVELENTVKLEPSSLYSSVKNLELSFYYFNYETESYELLATKTVDRHFNRDINETFSVTLENVPVELISENYLKKGEFIISEVKDFEIPELGIKYSEMMKSVKSKTIQMVLNTPLETIHSFVAPFKNKNRFSDLMESKFPNQFKIEDDQLTKVTQFENNLPDYTHLKEVKDQDKKGKWFVHTNRLTRTYLDHEFKAGEAIVISYMTGKELAQQSSEKVNSLRFSASGNNDYQVYPLGNVSPNSVVDFQLGTGKRTGEGVDKMEDFPTSGGSCGNNCYVWQFSCHIKFHKFKIRNDGYEFNKDLTEELSQLFIVINEEEFNIKTLVDEKKIEIHWVDKNAHFRINDVSKIKEIFESDENVISLKIVTLTSTTFEGVNLVEYSGRDFGGCMNLAAGAASHQDIPLYEGSKDFNQWKHWFNWNHLKLGKDRTYKQPFTLNISSSVNNYYN